MAPKRNRQGLDSARLKHLKSVIEGDIRLGRYYGAVILIARHGAVGMHEAIGFIEPTKKPPIQKNSVFSLFSTTKALTNVLASPRECATSFRSFPADSANRSISFT
jgi:CubicO group peptidase (beta-lactamase class C family)